MPARKPAKKAERTSSARKTTTRRATTRKATTRKKTPLAMKTSGRNARSAKQKPDTSTGAHRARTRKSAPKKATKAATKKTVVRKPAPKKAAKRPAKTVSRARKRRTAKQKPVDVEALVLAHPFTYKKQPLPALPDSQLTVTVLNLIGAGVHVDVACRACGVTLELLNRWIELAKEDPASEYAEFLRMCDVAVAQDEARDIMLVSQGAKFAPALQWKLTRKAPQRWGDRIHYAIDTAGLLVTHEEDVIEHDDETKAKMLAIMGKVGAFRELAQQDPDLAASLELEDEQVDGPVNGSGKKKKRR